MSDHQPNTSDLGQLSKYVLSAEDIVKFKIAPAAQIYLKVEGQTIGPFQDEKLKELIPQFKDIFIHSMIRTAANDTWKFFFEHELFDRRTAELRFAPDFDWKNATFSYLAQGQKSPALSLAKLKHYVASGRLRPLDHICIEPGHTWAKICQLPFFNRRGKNAGMALPEIPDEEVFADATRIAIERINQEEHLDTTLGEILSANEKANDPLGNLTRQILGKKKSTIVLRALSVMAGIVIITALCVPSHKTTQTTKVTSKTSTAPMARVIGVAEGLGTKAKSLALKVTSSSGRSISSLKSKAPQAEVKKASNTVKRSASVSASAPRPAAAPKQIKVAPIKSPTTLYGRPTRKPHLLPENERQNLDYEGTSFNSEAAPLAVYDQDPNEENRAIASEDEYNEEESDNDNADLDSPRESSLREKLFVKKMRQAFQEQARQKKSEEEGEEE